MLNSFIDALKDERTKQGLRQKDLAELSGVSVNTIHNYETGVCSASCYNAEALINALGYEIVIIKKEETR